MTLLLGIIIGISLCACGIVVRKRLSKACAHDWEFVDSSFYIKGNDEKVQMSLYYCSKCAEFSIKKFFCTHVHKGHEITYLCKEWYYSLSESRKYHTHGYGGWCSTEQLIARYTDKEKTEDLMVKFFPEYLKYIRSPIYDAYQLDKQIEEYDPLLEKFKTLESKMKNKANKRAKIKARIENPVSNLTDEQLYVEIEKEWKNLNNEKTGV